MSLLFFFNHTFYKLHCSFLELVPFAVLTTDAFTLCGFGLFLLTLYAFLFFAFQSGFLCFSASVRMTPAGTSLGLRAGRWSLGSCVARVGSV